MLVLGRGGLQMRMELLSLPQLSSRCAAGSWQARDWGVGTLC